MSFIVDLFRGSKPKTVQPYTPPQVNNDTGLSDEEKKRLQRTGRASLIATSSEGVLGNAKTGRKQLTAY